MRKLLLVAALALVVVPMSASADPIAVGDTFKFTDGPGNTGGGEFGVVDDVSIVPVDDFDTFVTFCVQKTEYMNFSDVFRVSAISDRDSQGVTLKAGTAWLYREFSQSAYGAIGAAAIGALGYAGNQATANGLQKVIWYFQGQSGATLATVTGDSYANAYYGLALAALGGAGNAGLAYTGSSVRIMQVVKHSTGAAAQDQLVVPEPASLMLLGLGLVGIAARLRRRL